MINLILFSIGILASSAQVSGRVISVDNVAAYLRVDAFLLNAVSGDSDTYECIVQYADKARQHSTLNVISQQSNKIILRFDPSGNSLVKIFPQDVTGDGHVELVTEWTHGNDLQLIIHTLGPVPKLIFSKAYRYGMSICQDSDFRTRIRVISGPGIGKKATVEEYIWSNEKSEFILDRSY
jgi:hypothetical protein